MKTRTQFLKLALATLLFAAPLCSTLFANPPHTGIRGQTQIYQPGFWIEIEPGLWAGHGGFSFGWPASFAVFSAHSGKEVAHVNSDLDGSFSISLPPGNYAIVPDEHSWLFPMSNVIEVTVTARHFSDIYISYVGMAIAVGLP